MGVSVWFPGGELHEKGVHGIWELDYASRFGPQGVMFEVSTRPVLRPARAVTLHQLLDDPLAGDLGEARCFALSALPPSPPGAPVPPRPPRPPLPACPAAILFPRMTGISRLGWVKLTKSANEPPPDCPPWPAPPPVPQAPPPPPDPPRTGLPWQAKVLSMPPPAPPTPPPVPWPPEVCQERPSMEPKRLRSRSRNTRRRCHPLRSLRKRRPFRYQVWWTPRRQYPGATVSPPPVDAARTSSAAATGG